MIQYKEIFQLQGDTVLEDALAYAAVAAFSDRGLTLATAESCTGGLVAKRITDVSGSSKVFMGGVVSYSNDVKIKILGVSEETLAAHGAVSEETAREMALGARERLGSDIAVSTTGIAGPSGGSEEKPVGTVCFGVASSHGVKTYTEHFGEELPREAIRELASDFALSLAIGEGDRVG